MLIRRSVPTFLASLLLLVFVLSTSWAVAQSVDDLRITEVVPSANAVEVTHIGSVPMIVPNDLWICHNSAYSVLITQNETFDPGESRVYTTTSGLSNTDSDVWLYRDNSNFADGANIIHGLDYGPSTGVRTPLAVGEGKWTAGVTLPAPNSAHSLTNPTGSFDPNDWYIDANPDLGTNPNDNYPLPGSVTPGDELQWPQGVQDFEDLEFGDPLVSLEDWAFVDGGAGFDFTARAAGDTPSTSGMRPDNTTTWVRVYDNHDGDNRFYGTWINAPEDPESYRFSWYMLFEEMPQPGATGEQPRIMVQYSDGLVRPWGIEFGEDTAYLLVTASGGIPAAVPIGAITEDTWYRFDLLVNFDAQTAHASIDLGDPVSAPINPSGIGDLTEFRFCYRGDGATNMVRLLLDELGFIGTTENAAPTISVTADGNSVGDNDTLTVEEGDALSSLALEIVIDDPDGDLVSVSATFSELGSTTNVDVTEFESAPQFAPYTLAPTSGTVDEAEVTHTIELTAEDDHGNPTTFTFHIEVAEADDDDDDDDDNGGGCGMATSPATTPWALLALLAALALIRRRA